MSLPDTAGACAGATMPLYRLFNDGKGGAPNHRYTPRLAIRSEMLAQGWVAEGFGIGVIGCVPPAPVTIVAAGDIGQCFGAPAAASGAARTAAIVTPQDALVLTLGDHAYDNGTPEEFASCFHATWGAFKDRIHPSPGNHDYYTVGAEGYFGYFGAQAGPDRRGYYSFDFGGWHFISLNSLVDASEQSEQYAWLKSDLAMSSATLCTIAYWHYPAFNSGATYGNVTTMLTAVRCAARGRRGDRAVGARPHLRAVRAAERRRDGGSRARRAPVRRRHRRPPAESDGTPAPNSEFRQNASLGVLRLTLDVAAYGWQSRDGRWRRDRRGHGHLSLTMRATVSCATHV